MSKVIGEAPGFALVVRELEVNRFLHSYGNCTGSFNNSAKTNHWIAEESVVLRPHPSKRPFVFLASHPVGSDPSAGRKPLCDRGHRRQGSIQDSIDAIQGKPIDDLLAPAFGLNESAVTETREMGGDARLRLRHLTHQLVHGAFTLLKELEDP